MTHKKTHTRKNANKASAQIIKSVPDIFFEEQHELIAQAAYFIAEEQGFPVDSAMKNWLQAEDNIKKQLSTGT